MLNTIVGNEITLLGNPETFEYTVSFDGLSWTMSDIPFIKFSDGEKVFFPKPSCEGVYETGYSDVIYANYNLNYGCDLAITTEASVNNQTDEVLFSVRVEGDEKGLIEYVSFPSPFEFGTKSAKDIDLNDKNIPNCYTVLSRKQGALIPVGMEIALIDGGKIFSEDSYMPVFGQVRYNSGYLAIYDTPYDALYEMRFEDGDKVAPLFTTSLGRLSYPRKMRYRFMRNCDYNDFAASYRSYVAEKGELVTLREKAIKNPRVNELVGCPIIHTGIARHVSPDSSYYNKENPSANDSYVTFAQRTEEIKELKNKGLKKAYTHFDGWGRHGYDNLHPMPFPPHQKAGGFEGMKKLADTVNGCGYIFGIHDQYRDYYYDAPNFSLDNAVEFIDGNNPFCSIWNGGKHTFLCSAKAVDYVKNNYAVFEENGIDIRASYLDVFSIVGLDECFNPAHPVTRKECAENRRSCLDYLTSKGIIPSSEETTDCIVPSLVLCHHAPFNTSWEGNEIGIPIPLFNLVYHDCIIVPWIDRKGANGSTGLPLNLPADRYAKLCANPVYLSITADREEIEKAEEVCAVAERLAFEPMIRHEFVTADRRIQKTTYKNGETVEVNMD